MAVNRPQASELLNMSEMRLFDDSRPGALRAMTRAALAARVARSRAARDRARDLLKRQKQAARARGDVAGGRTETALRTARKEALLVDILQRFVDARRDAPATAARRATSATAKAAKAPAAKTAKPAKAKASATVGRATKATGRTAPPAKAVTARKAATTGKAVTARKAATTGKAVTTSKAATATVKPAPRLTPRKALANTRKLLAAKQQRDREAQPWQSLDPGASHVPEAGYQSPEAKAKAVELHAAESRMASNHGSMGARDRHAQGRRDHRGDTG